MDHSPVTKSHGDQGITKRKVKSEKFIRHWGVRMQKIDIPEGQSILRSHLEGVNNILGTWSVFAKVSFQRKTGLAGILSRRL